MPTIHLIIICFSSLILSFVPADPTSSCCSGIEAETTITTSAFDRIKALAGEWVRVGADGEPTDEIISQIRVTAGGSAVIETLFPGTDKEMITLYHLDGGDLVLTHYCVLGNQPRMKAETIAENKIVFVCDGTGVTSADDAHMHQGTINWLPNDRLKTEWLQYTNGEVTYTAGFQVVRR